MLWFWPWLSLNRRASWSPPLLFTQTGVVKFYSGSTPKETSVGYKNRIKELTGFYFMDSSFTGQTCSEKLLLRWYYIIPVGSQDRILQRLGWEENSPNKLDSFPSCLHAMNETVSLRGSSGHKQEPKFWKITCRAIKSRDERPPAVTGCNVLALENKRGSNYL